MAATAFSAINLGSGILNTVSDSMTDNKYRITCRIEIENLTTEDLRSPVVRVAKGRVDIPPRDIRPGSREVMVARKVAHIATGTFGTVSWLLQSKNRRIVVMWAAPFNFTFHDNVLAVGMTEKGNTDHAKGNKWFKEIYGKHTSSNLKFNKMAYTNDIETVIYEEDGIRITGIMSAGHQANVVITVRSMSN